MSGFLLALASSACGRVGFDTDLELLEPAADTFVSEPEPQAKNGEQAVLRVDGVPARRTLLRFDIPEGSANMLAELGLFAETEGVSGLVVRAVDGAWSELQTCWDNAPAPGEQLGVVGAFEAGSWVVVDLGETVSAGPLDLMITHTGVTQVRFSSREGDNSPWLRLRPGPLP